MERRNSHTLRRSLVAGLTAAALAGCGSNGEQNNEGAYPLGASHSLYKTVEEANNRQEPCTTLNKAVKVKPLSVDDVGGWLVLKLGTSGIRDYMVDPNACSDQQVFTTFK